MRVISRLDLRRLTLACCVHVALGAALRTAREGDLQQVRNLEYEQPRGVIGRGVDRPQG